MAEPARDGGTQQSGSNQLLTRARRGDRSALSALFRRHGGALRKWARGRLPQWARVVSDTADIVQDALLQTFRRIDAFEDRGKGALEAYLRRAVQNRIRDEVRRVMRRQTDDLDDGLINLRAEGPSPFEAALDAENERKYKQALATLSDEERVLVVGRLELGYNYDQLAVISRRPTAEAARLAVRRAVIRLAERMSDG